MEESRLDLLRKGECLTTSELLKQEKDMPKGGVIFAVRGEGGSLNMVQITKPKIH